MTDHVYVQHAPQTTVTKTKAGRVHSIWYWIIIGWFWSPLKWTGRVALWLCFFPLGLWRSWAKSKKDAARRVDNSVSVTYTH